jgi:hypothetical protein
MKIMENYAAIGVVIEEEMEEHLGAVKNTDIAVIGEGVLDELVKDVVGRRVEAVTTFCTNLFAAQRVEFWEKEHGIPVFDTVVTVIWDMLAECGVMPKALGLGTDLPEGLMLQELLPKNWYLQTMQPSISRPFTLFPALQDLLLLQNIVHRNSQWSTRLQHSLSRVLTPAIH